MLGVRVYKKPFESHVVKATISGIRGIVGKDMNLHHVLRFCSSFASMIPRGRCAVGRDTRPSGDIIYRTTTAALMSCGIEVLDMGIAPTPAVFYESSRCGAGVVVTASHNPIEWNGLKFILNGRGITNTHLDHITEGPPSRLHQKCGPITPHTSKYAQEASRIVGHTDRRVSILVDPGGGVAAYTLPSILQGIGCNVKMMQGGIRPDPTAGGLDALVQRSAEYDMGAALDMDGDRLVLVMDGNLQPPDATLALGVAAAMQRGHDTFVFSRDTSITIEEYVREQGGRVYRSAVGEANVVEEMVRRGAGAGGEGSSGGFILSRLNCCRDGMLAAGLAASLVSKGDAADILREMSKSSIIRTKVRADTGIIKHISDRISDATDITDSSDGMWGMLDDGSWVLVRESNTESVIRLSAEAPTMKRARDIIQWVSDMIKDYERE